MQGPARDFFQGLADCRRKLCLSQPMSEGSHAQTEDQRETCQGPRLHPPKGWDLAY